MSALRFLYAVILDRPEQAAHIPLPRKADPLPAILSPDEVAHLLAAVSDLWMRALLTTIYAAGRCRTRCLAWRMGRAGGWPSVGMAVRTRAVAQLVTTVEIQ